MRTFDQARERGSILLSVLVATVITVAMLFYFIQSSVASRRSSAAAHGKVAAEAYAAELVEFFRAMKSSDLKTYLSTNPQNASLAPYFLCSQINILDRSSGNLLNQDPIAALPTGIQLGGTATDLGTVANRYYQVEIINIQSMQLRTDVCDKTMSDIYLYNHTPGASETVAMGRYDRFFVTVGVSWKTPGTNGLVQRITLNATIPDPT